ncbi:tetratricopeptide repeat protein [Hydrogenophaga sp.]|uniref:tetratricopeptide repeat protein n=1 Tax=Hydrogenophaga sp. TaxID=1904254 RepID=UPI002720511E|nr:tetratricopeptide repeat protein [Hydrogenophaga sp.]MDO9503911.1 tetratricopeptide repeat protein [Hydrogenophaga sp.]
MPLKAAQSAAAGWQALGPALAGAATLLGGPGMGALVWLRVWRRNRQNADALAALAYWRARSGRPQAALRWQGRCVQLRPQSAQAHFNLGFLLEQLQQDEAARLAFERATELAPQLDLAWFGLARCLERQGRLDEALPAYQRNAELQPWSPHAHAALARLHARQGRPEQAQALIAHLRGFEPRVAAALQQELQPNRPMQGRAAAHPLGTHTQQEAV